MKKKTLTILSVLTTVTALLVAPVCDAAVKYISSEASDHLEDSGYSSEVPTYEGSTYYGEETSGYLLPDADRRAYTAADIRSMPLQVVCYAKNEIYARHGRKFVSRELQDYFNSQYWYTGTVEANAFSESVMNQTELNNIELLSNRERELSGGTLYVLDQPGYNYNIPYSYINQGDYYYNSYIPTNTPAPAPAPYSGYDILSGLRLVTTAGGAYFEADHFRLTLPNVENYSHNQLDKNAFEIYYVPARNDGFGGKVVTIRAYDPYDTAYQNLPSWKICGRSRNWVYVAIFPTDLQCNPNNPAQLQAYTSLYYWARRLNDYATDGSNPFVCYS